MKQPLRAVFAIAILWACLSGSAGAQTGGLTMYATAGFGGYCRSNGWCPVQVVVENQGTETIEGEVQVGSLFDEVIDLFSMSVTLPGGARKEYDLYVPVSASTLARLPVRFVSGRTALSTQQLQVHLVDARTRLYGIANGSAQELVLDDVLEGVAPAGGQAVAVQVALAGMPANPLGWEALDVLVVSDADTTGLPSAQREALRTWVAHGGHLIVGGGAGAVRTAEGLADLLPVTVRGTLDVADLDAVGEWAGVPMAGGSVVVADAELRDGEALVRHTELQDLVLLARRHYGAGMVHFVGFDAGQAVFEGRGEAVRFWQRLVGSERGGILPVAMPPVDITGGAYEAVTSVPGLRPVSVLVILAFLLVYTAVVGPLNYLILRRMDRRELAWITIPVLTLLFTGIAYLSGLEVRGTRPVVHRLTVIDVPEGTDVGRISQVIGLFSPRRARYDLRLASGQARRMGFDFYAAPERRPLHVLAEAGGSLVTDLRADAGGIRPLLAEGYASVSPVQADLRLRIANDGDLQLTGSVRNGDMPLEDAVLVVGDEVYQFGTLRENETVSVGLAFTASTDVVSVLKGGYTDMPALIVGADELWSDPDLYRRYRFLSALYATGTVDPLVYLVGWTNAPAPLPVELSGSQATKQGTTVVVYRMVLDGVEGHGRFILPPGFMAREVEETSAGVSLDSGPQGSLYLEAGAHVVLRFTPWTEGLVDDVDRLTVTAQGDNPNGLAEPTVSLWDEERAVWDPLASAWGASAEVDADRYLLPAGQVRVRVDADEAGPVWVFGVGVALAGQR